MKTIQNRDVEEVLEGLVRFIDEKMGSDTTVLDVSEVTSLTSYIIVTTAAAQTHANAMGKNIVDYFLDHDYAKWLHTRNPDYNNPWILVDAGDIVVHIFLKETREFYNIEKIYFRGNEINPDVE